MSRNARGWGINQPDPLFLCTFSKRLYFSQKETLIFRFLCYNI
ncbi:hypothetical protein D920_02832 [Enterococcus faecalis 13-SD-W-01]|nr:hypothetical protein D920_02832 [Enterococcus faecalis 13-SD-W-01]